MKFFLYLILLFVFFTACKEDESEHMQEDDEVITGEQDSSVFEINIDDSDLAILPKDGGGIHKAVPLGSTSANFGYYVYTPENYTVDGPEYPLLVFLHGWGANLGNEPLSKVLEHGPPKLIKKGRWKPSYPFIVVTPQLKTLYWEPFQVHKFIEYLMDTYQINPNRIYLTGLSLGGGGCWHYAGGIKDNYAAAIVPICARGAEFLIDNLKEIPVWAFHGNQDTTVDPLDNFGSVTLVRAINNANPKVKARITLFPFLKHDSWTATYNGDGRNLAQYYDTYNVDIYDWMLTYKKK